MDFSPPKYNGRLKSTLQTETINKNRHKDMYLLAKIPELIERAEYDRTEDLSHPREDKITKFHILYAKAKRGNKTKIVLIKIAEDNQGNKFFILKPVQTIKNGFENLSQLSHNGSQGVFETIYIIPDINTNLNPNVTNRKQTFEEAFTDVFFEALAEVLLETQN